MPTESSQFAHELTQLRLTFSRFDNGSAHNLYLRKRDKTPEMTSHAYEIVQLALMLYNLNSGAEICIILPARARPCSAPR